MIPEKGSIRGVARVTGMIKTQFVDGSILQGLIQKKLQLIFSEILISIE